MGAYTFGNLNPGVTTEVPAGFEVMPIYSSSYPSVAPGFVVHDDIPGALDERVLSVTTPSWDNYGIAPAGLEPFLDGQMLVRMYRPAGTSFTTILFARGVPQPDGSTAGRIVGYDFARSSQSDRVLLSEQIQGATNQQWHEPKGVGYRFPVGFVMARLELEGNQFRTKTWPDSEEEPESWDASLTLELSVATEPGLWGVQRGVNGSTPDAYVDWISIEPNGEASPPSPPVHRVWTDVDFPSPEGHPDGAVLRLTSEGPAWVPPEAP